MLKYILKRVLLMLPIMAGVIIVISAMLYFAPGDPARQALGQDASEEAVQEYREVLGLNDPFHIQLFNYVGKALRGDLGNSFRSGQPVINDILSRLSNTIKLALLSVFFGGVLGVLFGVISAVKQYSILDKLVSLVALVGIATPSFWLALMMIMLFSVHLGWLPASGVDGWKCWVMPVISLSLYESGFIMRMSRSAMLDVLRQDYMMTARAKGQEEWIIIFKHGFRNALLPIVTTLGVQICSLLSGAVVTESMFAIPGIGKYCYDSIVSRDFPAVQGALLFVAILCVLVNLIMDILYCLIDPRIKAMYGSGKGKERRSE